MHPMLYKKIIEPKGSKNVQEMVMLHGFGFHSGVFHKLITQLAKRVNLRITLIDLPGFGKNADKFTDCSGHSSIKSMAELILKQAPSKAIWLGWSLGGLIIWWLAINYPERLLGFITLATTPKFIAADTWQGVPHSIFQSFQENMALNPQKTLLRFLLLQGNTTKDQKVIQFLKDFLSLDPLPSLSAFKVGLEILQTTDLREGLSKITCPGLSFFGENDQLIPIAPGVLSQSILGPQSLIKLSSQIKSYLLPKHGHGTALYEPSMLCDEIACFCQELL